MAEITPITRDEFYLAKAGGQDVPVPSAVTREEYYLEKLTNDNVVVPTPVTRREKFLYFACGGEIDLPSEEKMTRLERLIAKAGGMDISTPTAITRLEKFWANVEGGGWKTITGVLPLTFTAKGGTAVDWVIYGNDDNGTENLFDGNYQSAFIDLSNNKYSALNEGRTAVIQCDPNTQYTISVWSGCNGFVIGEFETEPQINDTAIILSRYSVTIPQYITVATGANAHYIAVYVSNQNNEPTISIVKGSTAPDHYIPHQQGVGERTENLFDCRKNYHGETDNTVAGVRFLYGNQSITLSQTANGAYPQQQISGEDGILTLAKNTQYYGKLYIDNAPEIANISMLLQASTDGSSYTTITTIRSAGVTFTPNDDYTVYRWLFVAEGEGFTYNNTIVKFALVEGSTAPDHYIPYGYEIPISISHNMLGKAKVGPYESTGFSPSSTGSLTTEPIYLDAGTYVYRTPNMEFRYASRKYIVDDASDTGTLFTNAQPDTDYTFAISKSGFYTFQINKQSGTVTQEELEIYDATAKLTQPQDYTFYIGLSPLTAGQSISKTSTGVDIELFSNENTVSTTLYNKPDMEIKYK